MTKPKTETEEFVVTFVKKRKLNDFINEFRELNPRYDVLNISVSYAGVYSYHIVWRKL